MNKYLADVSIPFVIRSYEVGDDQKATIFSIANYFQEAAGVHADQLDFDITDLHKQGLTWMLFKMHLRVFTFPKRWQNVSVQTWPSSGDPIRAFRDYRLIDNEGSVLATGLSQWMTIDVKSKRLVRIPNSLKNFKAIPDNHNLDTGKEPIQDIPIDNRLFITTVGKHDLDMNNHVNNTTYIEWITGYSKEILQKKCTEITIQYVSESLKGDQIFLSERRFDNNIVVTLSNQNNDTVARAIMICT